MPSKYIAFKKVKRCFTGFLVFSLYFSFFPVIPSAQAANGIPMYFNFGGVLKLSGVAVTGTQNMQVDVFPSLTGGASLYTQTISTTFTSDGAFVVTIGPVTNTLFADDTRYLEVSVGSTTMSPRLRFASVPYAFNANNLNSATGTSTATGNVEVSNNVTAANLSATNQIQAAQYLGVGLSLTGASAFGGLATFNGGVIGVGSSTFTGQLNVGTLSAANIAINAISTPNVGLQGFISNGSSTVLGNFTTTGNLTSGGTGQFANLFSTGSTTVGGVLNVSGNALLGGNLDVAGLLTNGGFIANGSSTIIGTATVTTGISTPFIDVTTLKVANLNLASGGTASFTGLSFTFGSATSVNANSVQIGSANVGSATFAQVNSGDVSSGTGTFGSTTTTGTTATSGLQVSNFTQLNVLNASGATTLQSTLSAAGLVSLNSGFISGGSSTVIGNFTSTGTGQFANLYVSGSTTQVGTASFSGGLSVGSYVPSVTTNMLYSSAGSLYFNGVQLAAGGASWSLTGNSGLSSSTNFIGTTDAVDLVFKTNNGTRTVITAAGNFGVGTSVPGAVFSVAGGALITGTETVSTGISTPYIDVTTLKVGSLNVNTGGTVTTTGLSTSYISSTSASVGSQTITGTSASTGLSSTYATFNSSNTTGTSTMTGLSSTFGTFTSVNANQASVGALSAGSGTFSGSLAANSLSSTGTTATLGLQVSNFAQLNSVNVSGATSLQSTLSVAGLSSLTGFISNGSSTVVGDFTTTGNELIGGTLGVSGVLTASSGLVSQGSSSFVGSATFANGIFLPAYTPAVTSNALYSSGGSLYFNGVQLASGGAAWNLTGNSGLNSNTNFIGTTDAVDLVFKTANATATVISAAGNFGIGSSTPQYKLVVAGTIAPAADATYDLGSPTNRFRNFYTSGTVNFASTPIFSAGFVSQGSSTVVGTFTTTGLGQFANLYVSGSSTYVGTASFSGGFSTVFGTATSFNANSANIGSLASGSVSAGSLTSGQITSSSGSRVAMAANGQITTVQFDVISGNGVDYQFDYDFDGSSDANDPTVTLVRGQTYRFNINAAGHPFRIENSDGSAYTSGLTNNGASSGTIVFTVPYNSPSVLRYQCDAHAGMTGQIIITSGDTLTDSTAASQISASSTALTFTTGSVQQASLSSGGLLTLNNAGFIVGGSSTVVGNFTSTGTGQFANLYVSGSSTQVGTASFSGGLSVGSYTPSVTTNMLYSSGGSLYFNGSPVSSSSLTGSTGQIAYFSGANTAVGTSSLFIATSGNVGVGTNSPTNNFSVNGLSYFGNNVGIGNANPTGLLFVGTMVTPNLFVSKTSGNVGIGVLTPLKKLQVVANTQFDGIALHNGTNYVSVINGNSATNDNGALALYNGGTSNVFIQASGDGYINAGNLGIGNISPSKKLTVTTNTTFDGIALHNGSNFVAVLNGSSGTNDNGRLALYNSGSITNFIQASGDSYLTSGNIGIGTITPGSLLAVQGIGNFSTGTNTMYSSGGFNLTGGGCYAIAGTCLSSGSSLTGSAGQIAYFQGANSAIGTSSIFISTTQNVGIGTSSPISKLTVAGTITPDANLSYDLGSLTNQWRSLYVGSSTIYIGGVPLKGINGALTWAGSGISSVGTGTNSEIFGASSSAGGAQSVSIGNGAGSTGAGDVIIGYAATAGGLGANVVIGKSANSAHVSNVVIGNSAVSTGGDTVTVGVSSSVSGNGGVAIGKSASAAGNSTVVGNSSSSSGGNGVVVGQGSTAAYNYATVLGSGASSSYQATALGQGAATTAHYQLVAGSSNTPAINVYFGQGVTNASPSAYTINGVGGSGTDITGGSLQLAGGIATGNAAGGDIVFQTSNAGGSGSGAQSLTTKMTLKASGNVGIGTATPGALLQVGASGLYVTSANYVGIGTSTPSQALAVNGQIYSNGTVSASCFYYSGACLSSGSSLSGSTGQIAYFSGANTAVGTSALSISTSGNVGIGTTTPTNALDITGDSSTPKYLTVHNEFAVGADFYTHSNTAFRAPTIGNYRSRGTQYSPTAVQSADALGYLQFSGYTGSAYSNAFNMEVDAAENWSGTNQGVIVKFQTTITGASTVSDRMRFTGTGDVVVPNNALGVSNGIAVGSSYAGVISPPTNGMIVSGNFGVGTSAPLSRFSLQGAGVGANVNFLVSDSAGAPKFSILDNGNVGIGTASPAAKLDIYPAADGVTPSIRIKRNIGAFGFTYMSDTNDDVMVGFDDVGTMFGYTPSASNTAGSDLLLSGGYSRGNQVGGGIAFQTANAGSSGSSLNYGSTRMYLTQAGNLGISTISPSALLSIASSTVSSSSVALLSVGTSVQGKVLTVLGNGNVGIGTTSPAARLEVAAPLTGTSNVFAIVASAPANNPVFRVNAQGDVFSDGANNIGGGADYAENYISADNIPGGTVVMLDPSAKRDSRFTIQDSGSNTEDNFGAAVMTYSASGSSSLESSIMNHESSVLMGVISTKPGVILQDKAEPTPSHPYVLPVALAGKVPVKVSNENGDIKAGDYLVPSKLHPGYAAKATIADLVVGVALEDFIPEKAKPCMDPVSEHGMTGEGVGMTQQNLCGKILVNVKVQTYIPSVDTILQNADPTVNQEIKDLNITDASAFGNLYVAGKLYVAGDVVIKGTLTAKSVEAKEQVCIGDGAAKVCVNPEELKKLKDLLSAPNLNYQVGPSGNGGSSGNGTNTSAGTGTDTPPGTSTPPDPNNP